MTASDMDEERNSNITYTLTSFVQGMSIPFSVDGKIDNLFIARLPSI